jgi:hypothetical protein
VALGKNFFLLSLLLSVVVCRCERERKTAFDKVFFSYTPPFGLEFGGRRRMVARSVHAKQQDRRSVVRRIRRFSPQKSLLSRFRTTLRTLRGFQHRPAVSTDAFATCCTSLSVPKTSASLPLSEKKSRSRARASGKLLLLLSRLSHLACSPFVQHDTPQLLLYFLRSPAPPLPFSNHRKNDQGERPSGGQHGLPRQDLEGLQDVSCSRND